MPMFAPDRQTGVLVGLGASRTAHAVRPDPGAFDGVVKLLGQRMIRFPVLTALVAACLALPLPAVAQTAEDRIVRQLRDQGFEQIEINRTLLGRVRILAVEDDTLREIVLDPSTGAILRDYWVELDDDEDDDDDSDSRKGKKYLLDSDERDDDDRKDDD